MVRPMQQVILSITKNGQYGLFTNGMLALPLSFKEYYNLLTMDREQACKLVRCNWCFELVGATGPWCQAIAA